MTHRIALAFLIACGSAAPPVGPLEPISRTAPARSYLLTCDDEELLLEIHTDGQCTYSRDSHGHIWQASCDDGAGNSASATCRANDGRGTCLSTTGKGDCTPRAPLDEPEIGIE
jgi:hypothetical protein